MSNANGSSRTARTGAEAKGLAGTTLGKASAKFRQALAPWARTGYLSVKTLTKLPARRSHTGGDSNATDHRREPPPRQAELLCPDLGPGVRRIQHPRGKEA